MRRTLVIALAALALAACEAPPPPGAKTAAKTTIQHDQPQPVTPVMNAGPLPPGADTSELPANHPKLGDGAKDHDAQAGEMPAGHPQVGEDSDAKALLARVEAMKDQLKDKPKTIEITVALGSLYYDNGRYLDAIDYYRQAISQGAQLAADYQAIASADAKVEPAELKASGCDRATLRDSDPMMARAKKLQAEGKKPMALACAHEAVRPVVMAHQRRGNAFYLVGNSAEAVKEHDAALAIDPDEPESLFFRGAILFDTRGDDVAALKQAQSSWQRFLAVAPDSPRAKAVKEMLPKLGEAIRLGGASKLPHPAELADDAPPDHAGGAPMAAPLNPGAADAIMNTEVTPELVQGFGKILDEATAQLAKGDLDGARTNVVRVFPFVMADVQKGENKIPAPVRAKAQALMGLYMSAKGAPMGGMMLQQATAADAKTVDALGDALKVQGDVAHAKALWQAISQGAPDYAKSAGLSAKLQ